MFSVQALLQSLHKLFKRNPDRLANRSYFQNIKHSFPSFILAHEGLWRSKALRKVNLAQAVIDPDLPKQGLNLLLLF